MLQDSWLYWVSVLVMLADYQCMHNQLTDWHHALCIQCMAQEHPYANKSTITSAAQSVPGQHCGKHCWRDWWICLCDGSETEAMQAGMQTLHLA